MYVRRHHYKCRSVGMFMHFISFYMCVYIYIYAGELVLVPHFSLSRVSLSTTSRVRNSTTFWGDHCRTTKIVSFWGHLWQILMPISVFLFSVFGPISDLFVLMHHLSQIVFFSQRGNIKRCFRHCVSKNTIKIVFLKGVFFSATSEDLVH